MYKTKQIDKNKMRSVMNNIFKDNTLDPKERLKHKIKTLKNNRLNDESYKKKCEQEDIKHTNNLKKTLINDNSKQLNELENKLGDINIDLYNYTVKKTYNIKNNDNIDKIKLDKYNNIIELYEKQNNYLNNINYQEYDELFL